LSNVRTQGGLGSTTVELRLHGENTGERGPGEIEGLGANQRVSRVAGEESKLTEATDTTEARDGHGMDGGPQWSSTGVRVVRERGLRVSAKDATERKE
jgi:hypothetical protein